MSVIRGILGKLHRKYVSLLGRAKPLRVVPELGRFQILDLHQIPDIDLAVGVLGTESFRRRLKPLALPVERLDSILVIAPHQDDETIGAGGTLLLAAAGGVSIHVLFVTDGGQDSLPPYSVQDIVRIRDQEAIEVCTRLGASIHRLGISNHSIQPTMEDVRRLAAIIDEVEPQVVMLPWILDWPAKHRLANHLLYLAFRRFDLPSFETWGYQVHNTLYPNGYVDITRVADAKRLLLRCYRSQNEHYRDYEHQAMGMAAWNERFLPVDFDHPVSRYAEVFFVLPAEELFRLVEVFYLPDLEATYGGDQRVIPGMANLHRTIIG